MRNLSGQAMGIRSTLHQIETAHCECGASPPQGVKRSLSRQGGYNIVLEGPEGDILYVRRGYGGELIRKRAPDGVEEVLVEEVAFFTVGNSGVYYNAPTDTTKIWLLDLASMQPSVAFESDQPTYNLSIAPYGTKLLYVRQSAVGADIMRVEHFRC